MAHFKNHGLLLPVNNMSSLRIDNRDGKRQQCEEERKSFHNF